MNVGNFYVGNIESTVCDVLFSLIKDKQWENDTVRNGTDISSQSVDTSYRDSQSIEIPNSEITTLFAEYVVAVNNNMKWNLDIQSCPACKVIKYEKGGHIRFHNDGNMFDTEEHGQLKDKTRKLSLVCWLNDDFEGGEFEFFDPLNNPESVIKPEKGKLVVFPSNLYHRVRPVTEGTRYSLVNWYYGPPIR